MGAAVCLSFFQCADFALPRLHLHATVQSLLAQGLNVVVTQAVLPGQTPQPMPPAVTQAVYSTRSKLFHKERLWNLAAGLTDAENLIFLDGDVLFTTGDWFGQTLAELKRCDVVQPFTSCVWLDQAGRHEMRKEAAAVALKREAAPKFTHYHPGFGWAFTRQSYNALGGFLDSSVAGNSDALFTLALRDNCKHRTLEAWYATKQDPSVLTDSYKAYRRNASSLGLRFGYPEGVQVVHLWHGERKNRQYVSRGRLFPRLPNGEYAVHDTPEGLQEWNDEAVNESTRVYFEGKKDDG